MSDKVIMVVCKVVNWTFALGVLALLLSLAYMRIETMGNGQFEKIYTDTYVP